jgi:formate hydrogenlyase subunit 3/multisubunit Na+/H+ antiporter MnhD subunit
VLITLSIALGIIPGPVLEYMETTASLISVPQLYVGEVMGGEALSTLAQETHP